MPNAIARRLDVDPQEYAAALPFPHCVIDGVLTEDEAALVRESFPPISWPRWQLHRNKNTDKRDCSDYRQFPGYVAQLMDALTSQDVIRALEYLTKTPRLLVDPYLDGGGMHLTIRGGFLDVHADFNINRKIQLRRAVNLLLFLENSEDGDLEFWDEKASKCVKSIHTAPGRLVVFTAGDRTFHGHPGRLVSPMRRSLACYYYYPELVDSRGYRTTLYRTDI